MNTGRSTRSLFRLVAVVLLYCALAASLSGIPTSTASAAAKLVNAATASLSDAPQPQPPGQGMRPLLRTAAVIWNYFTAINNRQYDASWALLSEYYRYNWTCCTPDLELDRAFYDDWWDRVQSVSVDAVYVISLAADTVVVYADVSYHLSTDETVPEFMPYFELVYDAMTGGWLINGKGTTADPRMLPTPDQTVRDYYAAVASHQYHITWPMLSRSFKSEWNCCTSSGDFDFDAYAAWWDSVSRVEVAQATVVAQTERSATVYADLIYYTKTGRVIRDPAYIGLALDDTTPFKAWVFKSKRASREPVEPMVPTPTPLPIGPTWQTPDQVITEYYTALGNWQYNVAWAMLSDNFKHVWACCTPSFGYDYSFYTACWNRVQRIHLGDIYTVRQGGGSAVVFANVAYQLSNGDWVYDRLPYKELAFDPARGRWLLDGQAASTDVHALPSPEQAVRGYYAAVSTHQYDVSWPLLSYTFKQAMHCCTATGDFDFQGYTAWWDTIARVEVGQVSVLDQTASRATVYAELRYVKKSGAASYEPATIELIVDAKTSYPVWVIDRVRRVR